MSKNDSKTDISTIIYTTVPDSPVLPDKFDCRVRRRHLTRGIVSLEDLKNFRKNLPDDSSMADYRDFDALVKDDGSDAFSNLSANGRPANVAPAAGGSTTH
jgi:hypothetical protein